MVILSGSPVDCPASVATRIADDYDSLATTGLPQPWEAWALDRYGIDVRAEYGGLPVRNPWGKASGQLSMNAGQVADDVDAGLGFVVLKTVIAQDASGQQTMEAWAIREARMDVELITGRSGETGWTVTWKGRGWWQSFDDYLRLLAEALGLARNSARLIVPSVKYHLPPPGETTWRVEEYDFTTQRLLETWRSAGQAGPMPIEKDFSPTLAGSDRATVRATVLAWLETTPRLIRQAVGREQVRVGLKLFNALFDDAFQFEMLRAIHADDARPDFFVYGNRLFDPERVFDGHRGVAYGGPDLSDRNLRVMSAFSRAGRARLPWCATGNIDSGRRALEYALCGAECFQLHTFFQLPLDQYRLKTGSRSARALYELLLHPEKGFIVWLHHLAARLGLPREPVQFRDVIGRQP